MRQGKSAIAANYCCCTGLRRTQIHHTSGTQQQGAEGPQTRGAVDG